MLGNDYPPTVQPMTDGQIRSGYSNKFNTELHVFNKQGERGLMTSDIYEHAFL